MASSSHVDTSHLAPPREHDGSFRLETLLTNRPTLSNFNAAFEAVKKAWGYYDPRWNLSVRKHLNTLGDAIGGTHLNWALFSLEVRHKLVKEVLPRLQDMTHLSYEDRRSQSVSTAPLLPPCHRVFLTCVPLW